MKFLGYLFGGFFLDIQREEKNVQKAIKEAAKRNDMGSAKVLYLLFCFCDLSLSRRNWKLWL